ncbi:MAG: hypothetical protein LUF90_07520 [Rikenellaceae bacterium]|nr:hypothetical protein [Rikenellaceae bacterium]
MNVYLKSGFLAVLLFIAAACIKDSKDNEDCWKVLRIEPRWIDTSPQSSSSTVNILVTSTEDQDDVYTFTSDINGVDVNLPTGEYEFIGWERADNVTVEERTVTVGSHASGTALEAGPFSGGSTIDEVVFNQLSQIIPLPMHQQTRQVYVRVIFTGNGLSLIDHVVGTLDGVALSRDIDNGFPPVNGEERPEVLRNGTVQFTLLRDSDGNYIDGHTLIGIDGDSDQNLDVRVMFENDSFSNISVDVTDAFDGFHTVNVHQPLYITLELNVGVNFEMNIIDWYEGTESWLEAQ